VDYDDEDALGEYVLESSDNERELAYKLVSIRDYESEVTFDVLPDRCVAMFVWFPPFAVTAAPCDVFSALLVPEARARGVLRVLREIAANGASGVPTTGSAIRSVGLDRGDHRKRPAPDLDGSALTRPPEKVSTCGDIPVGLSSIVTSSPRSDRKNFGHTGNRSPTGTALDSRGVNASIRCFAARALGVTIHRLYRDVEARIAESA
jgi:hypothetical protein